MRAGFKLLRTSTFRLAALYLAVFALSVGALLGYVYWNTAVLLERQTDETIRAEVQALADQYRYRGLRGIIDTIQRRSKDDRGSLYLLSDPQGRRVAGNLETHAGRGEQRGSLDRISAGCRARRADRAACGAGLPHQADR